MPTKTLTLDVSGKDKAAISAMHAYLRARGVDPGYEHQTKMAPRAQELADNPDENCTTGCLVPDKDGSFARYVMDSHWGRVPWDIAAVIIRIK